MIFSALPAALSAPNYSFPGLADTQVMDQAAAAPTLNDLGAYVPDVSPMANQNFFSRGISSLGGPMSAIQTGVGAISTLGNLWAAYQANKLANQQFNYTKGVTDTNLANSIQSYNTSLTDRATSRAAVNGQSDAERDAYIAANSLKDRRG